MDNVKKEMGNNTKDNTSYNTNDNKNDNSIEYIMFKLIKTGEETQFTLSTINNKNSDFIKYEKFLKNRYDLEIEDGEFRFYTDITGNNKIESIIIIIKSDYATKNLSDIIEQIKCDLEEEVERYDKNEIYFYS